MSYSNPAAAYRDREVATATPGRLVVMVFDHVLANLARAGVAHQHNLVEQRLEAVGKARDGIVELLATLDTERGGGIAQQLGSLYTFLLTQLADAGVRFDERKIARISGMVRELRDAFAAIATDAATRTTAA
jgi:flagellar secretion chaperone FliS